MKPRFTLLKLVSSLIWVLLVSLAFGQEDEWDESIPTPPSESCFDQGVGIIILDVVVILITLIDLCLCCCCYTGDFEQSSNCCQKHCLGPCVKEQRDSCCFLWKIFWRRARDYCKENHKKCYKCCRCFTCCLDTWEQVVREAEREERKNAKKGK